MTGKFKEKISDFFLSNRLLRKIRNFFNYVVLPFLIKAFLIFLLIILALISGAKIIKPAYFDEVYRKSSFYFLRYLHLDNHQFTEVKVIGNKRTSESEIVAIVNEIGKDHYNFIENSKEDAYQPIIKKIVIKIKEKLPWINEVVITRNMPNSISISVTEYEPFAIWHKDDEKYVADKDGNIVLVQDVEEFKDLLILSGEGGTSNVKSLFNIFAIDPNLSSQVYSATWIGGRRWDIRLDDGLLIKLPESNISEAWNGLLKIYNMQGAIVGLSVIDLRVEGKIYLEYGDSIVKEIKSL
ncbi:MAG: FtsQ-type POTRA domain-containing protein [Pelagibacterales bacterium]|nr:FtsQ-type POTRA domain-containing protein [Pelagibacterales bacterium]